MFVLGGSRVRKYVLFLALAAASCTAALPPPPPQNISVIRPSAPPPSTNAPLSAESGTVTSWKYDARTGKSTSTTKQLKGPVCIEQVPDATGHITLFNEVPCK